MGRPIKVKRSTTKDIGFIPFSLLTAPVVPTGFTPDSATEYQGVVAGEGNGGGVATSTYPVVKCRVFIAGQSEEDGWIIRQKGASKYLVRGVTSAATGVCTVANEAQGSLSSGNMNIAFLDNSSTEVLISRLTNKFAVDYSGTRYAVNFFTDEGSPIKSGTNGTTMALAMVEKYTT